MSSVKKEIVAKILYQQNREIKKRVVSAFAPTNIALCKYWGKRDEELNLPFTTSFSLTLPDRGAMTTISVVQDRDRVKIDNIDLDNQSYSFLKIKNFLALFRPNKKTYFKIVSNLNIPPNAGLASSACGFAAIVKCLKKIFAWQIDKKSLSILARLGSGSATRSFWSGFVKWQAGVSSNGMDSFGLPLKERISNLRLALLIIDDQPKFLNSTQAMKLTVATSKFYQFWPKIVQRDLKLIERAIKSQDFTLLGKSAERNSVAMHTLMQTAIPSINYSNKKTAESIAKIKNLRQKGREIYFTQDAGPNLKLLLKDENVNIIRKIFPQIIIINPFKD